MRPLATNYPSGLLALAWLLLPAPPVLASSPTYGLGLGLGEYMNLPGPPLHAGVYASMGIWADFELKR